MPSGAFRAYSGDPFGGAGGRFARAPPHVAEWLTQGRRAVAQARNLSHLVAGRIAGVSQGALLLERACNSGDSRERAFDGTGSRLTVPHLALSPPRSFQDSAVTTAASPPSPAATQHRICYSENVMPTSISRSRRPLALLIDILLALAASFASFGFAQQTTAPATPPNLAGKSGAANFASAADEVLAQMSEITGLALRSPLKKSLRSREEIRAHLIQEMDEDKDAAERYAGARSAEAFGLLPKGFDLDSFMVDLLTEQIAGLYDPKAHEFYVADWIPIDDQRMVMAHELTHALEDQHFKIEAWAKAARPNDDGELARESVLEGSAMAAMVEYLLQGSGKSVTEMPEFDPSTLTGDLGNTPSLQKAPPFIKDTLVFPYFSGMTFTAAALKPGGWSSLGKVFSNPPASTQQIMHPNLYKSGHVPQRVTLPPIEKQLGKDWKKLDDNLLGEFGWLEVLKQFLDEP